ncbi:MAG TPA: translation initiation factor IF-2 [Coleofasciculaceae cyanobacterium]
MNNDRVRIYELSKELHLENKDLLAICNELNIAVKSHSSTITEVDAERIRAVAATKVAHAASSRRESTTTKSGARSHPPGKAQPKSSPPHKQQILEIRKSPTLEATHSKDRQIASPVAPKPYSPPTPPMKPAAPPAAKIGRGERTASTNERSATSTTAVAEKSQLANPPARPVSPVEATPRPSQPEPPRVQHEPVDRAAKTLPETATQTVVEQQVDQPSVTTPLEFVAPNPQPVLELQRPKPIAIPEPESPAIATQPPLTEVTPEPTVVESEQSEISPKVEVVVEQPQLVKPPARPLSPVALVQKPSPEKPSKQQTPQKALKVTPAPVKPVETKTETTVEKPTRPKKVAAQSEAEPPKAKPVIELRRPKPVRSAEPEVPTVALLPKPALASTKSKQVDQEADSVELLENPAELLERPKLPRPIRGPKKRQEEEIDEGQESKGKAGAKVKRLKPIVEIEDVEEWDETGIDLDAALPANLAVARPAKQKAPTAKVTAKVASTAKATKGKKSRTFYDRQQAIATAMESKRERPEKLVITGSMTVQELAEALVAQDTEIVKILFLKGTAVNITQNLDIPTIVLVANELNVQVETAQPEEAARKITEMLDVADLENLQRRPPVVTIMGHVDHGKTTLLDSIRHTKVAQGEAGGITQHIGAYHVDVEQNGNVQQVVFLDTPGHEAFTAMRARGTRVTDIAVLVVAADDGVRPQTVEAISHAKAAQVPLVVAINKVDKPEAQPDRVMQELTEYGLVAEEWGGDTIMVPVSAIKGENLDTLLEMILLVAEVTDLQANPNRAAKGTVIEANLDKTRGPVATLLVQNGTLRVGDVLVAGSAFGKVRAMIDDTGHRVDVASPSFAVEVLGLSNVPAAGDEFEVFQSEKEARAIASTRADQQRQSRLMQGRISLATFSAQAQEGQLKELNLILKADVQGSVEAIVGALKQLPQNEVQLSLLLSAPGEISETDIDLAAASNAVIIGFNTTTTGGARQAADEAGVDVREYSIIYKLLEDIQGAMEGLLEPELVEEPLGQVEVRAVFPVGHSKIAGCYVLSGKVVRNCKLRVRRGGKVIHEGTVDSLKRMKDDVREVNAGYECGIGVDKFNDWTEGDIMETFQMVTKRRTLSSVK